MPMKVLGKARWLSLRGRGWYAGISAITGIKPQLTFTPPCPVSSPAVSKHSMAMLMPALASSIATLRLLRAVWWCVAALIAPWS